MSINKLSIVIVLLNILLLIQCFTAAPAAGGDDVNSANYSIVNSDFDPSQQKLHTIKAFNEIATPFSSSETQIFFLVANELHWINDATKTLVKLGRLVDFHDDKKILNFVEIKASRWMNQIIFVADIELSYYVYVISIPPKNETNDVETSSSIISPIQNLIKHGKAQSISFFHFEQQLFCLLGSNAISEHRSELRFLQWSRSYFQVIETIINRNHAIDMVLVSARHNLVLIIDNKEGAEDDTMIQVHRYQLLDKVENEVHERELITERIQDVFVPYKLTAANMFFYSDTDSQRLYLSTCNGPALSAVPNSLCEYYTWKRDGIAESTRFQRLMRFPLSEAIASAAEDLESISNDSRILNMDSLLAIRNGDSVYTFHGLADSRTLKVSETNLMDTLLEKRLMPDGKSIAHNLISIYRVPNASNATIELMVQTMKIFEEKVPDATLSAANALTPGDGPRTSDDIAVQLNRIKELLIDLRSHLISENEQFIRPMRSKIVAMKEALRMRQALQNGTIGPEPISIFCSQVKMSAAPNETTVDAILLNADQNHMDTSLAETYKRLMKINANPPTRAKRSNGFEETIHVRRLTILSENHPFKGVLLKNSPSNVYHLNGKIKTHTLRVNRVSGPEPTAAPTDSIVGDPGNIHSRIEVKSINGADWDSFVSSLYRKGRNTPINGNIVLTHPTSIRRLFTNQLNNVSPDDYLTIGTDQKIDSNVFISRIHVNQIESSVINNMQRFAEYVALIGRDNIVETRVKILVCNISNSLTLSDKEGEEMTQHIVGTRMEDLAQIYNGRIVIKGSLSLQNVQLLSSADDQSSPFAPIVSDPNNVQPEAHIIVGGVPFDLRATPQHYWMKSLDQNFADVTFTQPITAPQLHANYLLSHPTDEYFVLSEHNEPPNDSLPLNILFAGDTYVSGHLHTADPSKTTLQYLSRNAVRRGSRVTLSRPIAFSGHLMVDDIGMIFDTDQFVRRNRPASDTDTLFDTSVRKTFNSTVYIANDLAVVSDQPADITIDNFNEHQSLRKYFDTMILIDRPQSVMGTLIFDGHLFANNFTISVFIDNAGNTSPYDTIFDVNSLLGEIFNLRENRIEYLLLNGNVQFPQGDQLSIGTFNGIPLSDHLGLVVQPQTNETIQIFGTKTFASNVTMQIISVSSFNRQIYVDDWMGKALRQQSGPSATQVIDGGGWVIDKLIAENLEVRGLINGMRLPIKSHPAEFSDVIIIDGIDRQQPIKIWSNLLFTQGMQIGSFADLSSTRIANCDVSQLFGSDTIDLTHSKWNYVTALNAVQIPLPSSANPTKSVSEFFRDAVVSGEDQVIGGSGRNITMKTNRKIVFNRIGTIPSVKSQQPLINGVNLIDLYADAVTKAIVSVDGETQPILIEGQKEFLNQYVDLNGPETICAENLNARNMDGVDVLALNETLIRRANDNLVIADGHKLVFLKPTTIDRLTIDAQSTINGVGIDDIFFIYDKTDRPLRIIFAPRDDYGSSSMCVHVLNNFDLDTVNDLSLKYFLENRVRKYVENGVAMADINSDMQLVSGQLTFDNLIVSGSQTKIDMINDILCDDVVVTTADNSGEQHINGFKEIFGDLHIYQPFHTWTINGIELLSSYAKTVFLNQNQTLEQLSIHEPYRLGTAALNVRSRFNGITLPNEIEYSVISARSDYADEDDHLVGASKKSKVKRLNYIDITNDFAIDFNKTLFDTNNATDVHRIWLTVESFYNEIIRSANGRDEKESVCPVQYHIQSENSGKSKRHWLIVRRGAIGERLLTLTLNADYVVHIRTEFPPSINYYDKCNFKLHRRSKTPLLSRIFVNYKQKGRYPNQYIESANIFEVPQTKKIYLILHLFNFSVIVQSFSTASNSLQQVQMIPLVTDSSAPMIFNVKLIEWQQKRILIIAQSKPSNSGRAKAGAAHLQLYRFDEKIATFETTTKIDGDFNVISSIQIGEQSGNARANVPTGNSELHLILAKQGGSAVQIWKADGRATRNVKFVFKRELKLDGGIESLSTFAEHDVTYLSIILNDGKFHIYQYRLDGRSQEKFSPVSINVNASTWQKKMVGHFGGGKAMVPFTVSGKLYLFVFMKEKAARKGGKGATKHELNEIAKVYTLYYF